MRSLSTVIALLMCTGLWPSPMKDTPVDMTSAKTIFIGWVDINPDQWAILGYENEQQWSAVISWANAMFQEACQSYLAGRKIIGAQNRFDENASGKDLQVKFLDVRFDVNSYALTASIHFINPKSGLEIASIPSYRYRAGWVSITNCLSGALKTIADYVGDEIRKPPKKQKR